MTLTIELDPEIEAAVEADAKRRGRSREEMAAEAVRIVYMPSALTGDQVLLTLAAPDAVERLALAGEGMRHVWDTPEEDAAWAHLQSKD